MPTRPDIVPPVQWLVSQIGSREHYAVPRAFHARGHLWRLYTDVWLGPRSARWAGSLPGSLASLGNRSHPDLPSSRVTSFPLLSVRQRLRRRSRAQSDVYDGYDAFGRAFAEAVNRHVRGSELDPVRSAAFLFSTGALETARLMRETGVPVVVDQLDPGRLDERMFRAEAERWPGWEPIPGLVPDSYYARLAEEWRLADRVLVNSNWSRRNLLDEGVDPAKIVVVPLCYEPTSGPPAPRVATLGRRPLTVLWLGQVILRKGIPYLFEAARLLSKSDVKFIVAGRVGISEWAVASAPPNVKVLGRVTRAQTAALWAEADLFVLPTLSDGFALTQLEAMAAGLPVVATPNCGDVVTPGADGLIVPPADAAALAEAIRSLDADRDRLAMMSAAATATAGHRRFSLAGYAEAVEASLTTVTRAARA